MRTIHRGTDAHPAAVRQHAGVERLLVLVFVAVIVLPPVATTLGVDRAGSSDENRSLTPFPETTWSWATLRAFPDGFTRYFEDHFAFRSRLVRWQAAVRFSVFQVSPSAAVIRGREGWLFYAEDGAIDDYATAPPLTSRELEAWRDALQQMHDWLKRRGIAYIFVISPDKHQIYPEHMPATIRQLSRSRTDQLVEHLMAHSTVPVLDLRPALWRAKSAERIYHRTDTHWNDRGAHVAYKAILSSLAPSAPGLTPRPRQAFEPQRTERPGMDLASMLGLSWMLSEDDLALAPLERRTAQVVEPPNPNPRGIEARLVTERPDGIGPRAVVFRDSFASALIPFLSEHFSRVVYLWQYHVEPDVIEQERPDVVIQEMVGRRLSTILPYNPLADMATAGHADQVLAGVSGPAAERRAAPDGASDPDTSPRSRSAPPTP